MFMKTADIEEMKQQVEVKPETVFFMLLNSTNTKLIIIKNLAQRLGNQEEKNNH